MKEDFSKEIENTFKGLKDFQRATVDYVYDQLYVNGKHKMLIADEVGLGKTIVAKGIIAKAYQNWKLSKENPTFNVVYICSNQALVTQNLSKLNFTSNKKYLEHTINRLTYLAIDPKFKPYSFRIDSLTPGTSFDDKSSMGEAGERAILYTLLTNYDVFKSRKNGLRWILVGGKSIDRWDELIKKYDISLIRNDLFSRYRKELQQTPFKESTFPKSYKTLSTKTEISLWAALIKLTKLIDGRNVNKFNFQSEITCRLRRILSGLCLEYLGADIFILDEFQRYSNLIKTDEDAASPAIELARKVFSIKEAKVLMLSATPFKPYTNDFDELNGEVHYKEFKSVLRFLIGKEDTGFWNDFEKQRTQFFSFLRHPETLVQNYTTAVSVKHQLETIYRTVMVRTEKIMASNDKNAMIENMLSLPIDFQIDDIDDFVSLDKIVQELNQTLRYSLPIPVEYVKSTPYALSFLDKYKIRQRLKDAKDQPSVKKLLSKTKHAWINLERINEYKPLILRGNIPNAKLRLLLESLEMGSKMLWIPPSLNYYKLHGAYKNSENFSKTLVFSSWLMVPRMISTLISYEAERLTIGKLESTSINEDEKIRYFLQKGEKRSPKPQFTFRTDKENEAQQMNSFALIYPCITLAEIYDPTDNLFENKSISQIRKELKEKIVELFEKNQIHQLGKEDGDYQKWTWAAPLLLDKFSDKTDSIKTWLNGRMPHSELTVDPEDEKGTSVENKGKYIHFETAKKCFNDVDSLNLSILTDRQYDRLLDSLVDFTLGSPAICAYRTLKKEYPESEVILDASFNISSAFVSLFNKPESIAIVRLNTNIGAYWERMLEYCIQGCFQAMFDEYVYMLKESENLAEINELTNHITDVLGIRTSTVSVDDLESFKTNKSRQLRTHYAVDFGIQKVKTVANRQVNVRQNFNSPFRPFVLATTSIGQEGLDFHLYCKRIIHWNLPTNPIDFEQREGRINRYKGLVIRQNIASKYSNQANIVDDSKNVWYNLFADANSEKDFAKVKCDLVPFWHTEPENGLRIERLVPLYPFSKDISRYKNLIKILAFYRLTFGQPRQEEIVEALSADLIGEKELDELMIKLSPMIFQK